MTWELVDKVAGIIAASWVIAAVVLRYRGGTDIPIARTIWAELKPFYLPAVAVHLFYDISTGAIFSWQAIFHVCNVANWYFFRNVDDDDRWKRRKDKVTGKVKALASGRLTVVPAGAS